MRVYHFTKLEYGKKIIQDRRLKISLIDNLNDPYELRAIDLMDKERREIVLNTKNFLGKEVGVICFSKNWDMPIMWSHYADSHRGACLGFDIEDTLLKKMHYSESPYKSPPSRLPTEDAATIVERMLSLKHKPWAYECEYRLFINIDKSEGGESYKEFDDYVVPREFYFGVECEDVLVDETKYFIQRHSPGIKSYKTKLSDSAFKIVEDGVL